MGMSWETEARGRATKWGMSDDNKSWTDATPEEMESLQRATDEWLSKATPDEMEMLHRAKVAIHDVVAAAFENDGQPRTLDDLRERIVDGLVAAEERGDIPPAYPLTALDIRQLGGVVPGDLPDDWPARVLPGSVTVQRDPLDPHRLNVHQQVEFMPLKVDGTSFVIDLDGGDGEKA